MSGSTVGRRTRLVKQGEIMLLGQMISLWIIRLFDEFL